MTMGDTEKAQKLDDLLKISGELTEQGDRGIEKVLQDYATVDGKYLTFGRIDKLCDLFIDHESGKSSGKVSGDFADMIFRSVIQILTSFVVQRQNFAAGLRTKKGFMSAVKSRLGKLEVDKNAETITAFRRFLMAMVKLEHDAMRETRLRQEFLDATVKMIDKLLPKYQEEWMYYLELFLRMCEEQDCSKLIVSRRQEKRKKTKRREKNYDDHFGEVVDMICGTEELPDGISASHMLEVLELMSGFYTILNETKLLQYFDTYVELLQEESDGILSEFLLKTFKNIAETEEYQKLLIQHDFLVQHLMNILFESPEFEEDDVRSLCKEILWIMRDELALSPQYSKVGTELSKIAPLTKSRVGPNVVICIHKRINGDDDWEKLTDLRAVLSMHGYICHDIVDLDIVDLPEIVDIDAPKEELIILHKVCPFIASCKDNGNPVCQIVSPESNPKNIFSISIGEADEGEKDFDVDLDSPEFFEEILSRCQSFRDRASALRMVSQFKDAVTDSGVIDNSTVNLELTQQQLYVEVTEKGKEGVFRELTQKAWTLKQPNLVIFVNIGLESMPSSQAETIQRFRKLLRQTAKSADAWIVGGGVDPDSTNVNIKVLPDPDLVSIGIASIDNLKDQHTFCDPDNPFKVRPVTAASVDVMERERSVSTRGSSLNDLLQGKSEQSPIDNFNSHFIFIKTTDKNEEEDEIKVFQMLTKNFSSSLDFKERSVPNVPNVLIVVEGGPKTLKLMLAVARQEIPIIVYRGTGGVADIIARAEREFIQTRDRKSTREKIFRDEGFLTMFKRQTDKLEETADDIFEIVCKRHLVSTFDFNLDTMAAEKKGQKIEDHVLQSLHGTRFDILYKPSAVHIRNGNYYTLQLAVDAVRSDIKVIVFKDTYGLADFLVYYLQDVNIETKDALVADMNENMNDEYFQETKYFDGITNMADVAEAILELLRRRHLVKIIKPSPITEGSQVTNEDVVDKLFEVLSENRLFPIVFPVFPSMDHVTSVADKFRIPIVHFFKTEDDQGPDAVNARNNHLISPVYIEEEMFLVGNECRMMDFLLKSRTAKRPDVLSILRLSLKWNRVSKEDTDISTTAEDVLEEPITQPIKMDDELFRSLSQGDVDTFRLLASKRYSFQSFFSTSRHRQLYRSIEEGSPIHELLPIKDRDTTVDILEKVEKIIYKLIRYPINIRGMSSVEATDGKYEDEKSYLKFLFIYAVLMNYADLARFLWRDLKDRLPAALIAYGLLYQLSKKQTTKEARNTLLESAEVFTSLAVKFLTELSKLDSKRTREYLRVPIADWGNDSCLNIAYDTKNRTFISTKECQLVLDLKWATYLPDEDYTWDTSSKSTKQDASFPKDAFRVLKVIMNFFFAPRTIFVIYMLTHLTFLGLFSWFMLSVFDEYLTALEIVMYVWLFGRIVEEIRQVGSHGSVSKYFRSNMSKFDVFVMVLFLVGVGTRIPFAGYGVWRDGIDVTRILYGITLSSFYIRILYNCSVNRHLGPKILMIWKMIMADLSYYSVILFLPLLAYAVTAYAILIPNSTVDGYLFLNVLRMGYWPMYGEMNLDEIEGESVGCSASAQAYNPGASLVCPSENGRIFVNIFLGVYALLSNILLLNVLIAMFSNTFMRIEAETDKYAHFQRCTVIYEFSQKPFLPMPIGFFIYMYRFGMFVYWRCCCPLTDQEKMAFKKVGETQRWARDHSLHLVLEDDFSKGKSSGNWGVLSMSEKIDQLREELMTLQRQMNISEKHQGSKQTQDSSGFNVDSWKSEQRKLLRSELKQTHDRLLQDFKAEDSEEKSIEQKLTTGLEQLEIKFENMRRTEEIERQQNMKRIEEMIQSIQRGTPITPVQRRPPPPPPPAPVPQAQPPRVDSARIRKIEQVLESIERHLLQGNLISTTHEVNSSDMLERIMITEDRLLALENREKKGGEGPTITPSIARMQTRKTPIIEKYQHVQSAPSFYQATPKPETEKMNLTLQTLTERMDLVLKFLDAKPKKDKIEVTEEGGEDVTAKPIEEPERERTASPVKPVVIPEVEETLSKYLTQIENKILDMEARISSLASREEQLQKQVILQLQSLRRENTEDAGVRGLEKHFEAFGRRLNDTIKNDELLKRQLWEYQHRKEQDAKEVEGKVSRMEWAIQTLYFRLNSQGPDSQKPSGPFNDPMKNLFLPGKEDDDRFPPGGPNRGRILKVKPAEEGERLQNIEDTLQDMNDRLRAADEANESLQKAILDNLRVVRSHTEEEMQLVVRNALLKEKDHRQGASLGQIQNTMSSMDGRLNQTRADIRKIRDTMTEIADGINDLRQDRLYS